MPSKFITLTEAFFENEVDGLVKLFPELSADATYEIVGTEYLAEDENDFAITKLRDTATGAFFDIAELGRLPEDQRPAHDYWCFVYTDVSSEFEFVEK